MYIYLYINMYIHIHIEIYQYTYICIHMNTYLRTYNDRWSQNSTWAIIAFCASFASSADHRFDSIYLSIFIPIYMDR